MASGNRCRKAVAIRAPAARLSICWVYLASMAALSKAASQTLPTPAPTVPKRIAKSIISNHLSDLA
ncbi:hypothetical protein NBRC116584_34560 [Hydrogenophaga sp. 5NK40-0174]